MPEDRSFRESLNSLPKLLDSIWSYLELSATTSHPGWHLPVLVTAGPSGRTVVLRRADRDTRQLVCHTDVRSPKVQQIQNNAACEWVMYDGTEKVQLVAAGRAEVVTDGPVADRQWERSAVPSRRCYLAPAAPGTPLSEPTPNLPAEFVKTLPNEEQVQPGRGNFAAVVSTIDTFDFLYLKNDGNVRAEFDLKTGEGRWVAA